MCESRTRWGEGIFFTRLPWAALKRRKVPPLLKRIDDFAALLAEPFDEDAA
jgi:hypothetical protein